MVYLSSLNFNVDHLTLTNQHLLLLQSKLSDVVKNNFRKLVYDKLVAKVNNIDTSGFFV